MPPLVQKNLSVGKSGSGASADDFPIVITGMPANARQHKIAFRGFAILVVVVAIVTLANIQAVRVEALVPITQIVMSVVWLLTAAFLLAQYAVQPQRAQLALASGFVFSGLFAVLHTLAFPGAYGSDVVIGDELSSAGWLFLCWHTMFPITVIVYTLAKDEAADGSGRSTRAAIGITIACVVAITVGLTWGATAGATYLPRLFKDAIEQEPVARNGELFVTLLNATAIVLLFVRRRTILDQWLIVTLFAWLPNLVVASFFTLNRFTLGWYMARVYALFAGSSLLFVLLTETLRLYTRLANAVVLLRRSEQHQRLLIAELDHRVKNILAQVAGVAASTFQGSGSTADYVQSLGGRIQSMAAAHTLLSESNWRSVSLNGLLRTELAPYTTGRNVEIAGTDIMLTPAQTQALAKVLHELATNAAKYGSLLTPGGRVSVTWDRKPDGRAATLILEWRERGGPPVASKLKSSYGTALIRELIPHELGGKVDLAFASDGACCRIEFPLERMPNDLVEQL
jgi:two-component sensor histidine kinase